MINREMVKAFILTYSEESDAYGELNTGEPTKEECEVTLRIYNHSKVEDIRFNDVTHTSLIKNKTITDANKLQIGDKIYSIEFVNPEGRFTQLFLKEDK